MTREEGAEMRDDVTAQAESFQLMDKSGHVRAALEFSVQGNPVLWLSDAQGKPRITMQVTEDDGHAWRFPMRMGVPG